MKIGRKEDMDVSDKMALLVVGSHAPSSHSCAKRARTHFFCSLWLLEVIDCNENLHEGGHGLCQRNDINGFGMACV